MNLAHSTFLFDMDGLLLDTERLSFQCWSVAAGERGYSLSSELFGSMIGRPVAENESVVCAALGAEFPFWEVRARRVELMEQLLLEQGVPVKKGVREVLTSLSKMAYPLAVVTSTKKEIATRKLSESALLPFFQFVIGPEDVTNGKPAPDPYLLAATRLGVLPEHCIVFEDSPAGVRSGVAAGMKVVWIPDLVTHDATLAEIAYMVCDDIEEALAALLAT